MNNGSSSTKQSVWIVSLYERHHDGQTVIDSIWSSEEMALKRKAYLWERFQRLGSVRLSCDEHEVDPEDTPRARGAT